jgi:hypothetical protein
VLSIFKAMNELKEETVESSEMVKQTFAFWFTDQNHLRTPFPEYIRAPLQANATARFFRWAGALNEEAKNELNDEAIGEKFEEIIFEEAMKLVLTEDEKLTILYPFLPRIGDPIDETKEELPGKSLVIDRSISKKKDHSFMHLTLERQTTKEKWETSFELPH